MRIQAVVIKSVPVRENDRLIVCYTRHIGRRAYHAKSANRHTSLQRQHLELFNLVDFSVVEGMHLPIIASCSSLKSYYNLKHSLPALAAAYFVAECFDRVVYDEQPDKDLWAYLVATLDYLDYYATREDARWRDILAERYESLMKVMGYHGETSVNELSYANLRSLSFFDQVVAMD